MSSAGLFSCEGDGLTTSLIVETIEVISELIESRIDGELEASVFFESRVEREDLWDFSLSKLERSDNCTDGLEEAGEAPAYNFRIY